MGCTGTALLLPEKPLVSEMLFVRLIDLILFDWMVVLVGWLVGR
jgi:hypothetical protein